MDHAFLEATRRGDRAAARHLFVGGVPDAWFTTVWERLLDLRLAQLEGDPAVAPWLLRGMVSRRTGEMVGFIGFHTPPGEEYLEALAPGAVEFGFTVFEGERRRGFAEEASRALMGWAAREHGCTRFVLTIDPNNHPSRGLASKLGFRQTGRHIDEIDGEELIFQLDASTQNANPRGCCGSE